MMLRSIVGLLVLLELIHLPAVATQAQPQATPGPANPNANMRGDVEILSDTQGVDFHPYLQQALFRIKTNWYNVILEVARPPIMKSGIVIIEFAILKDGKVSGMALQKPSGDVDLDRAAWGGITASAPFTALPSEFAGSYLALRVKFVYNQKDPSFSVPLGFHPEDLRPAPASEAQETSNTPSSPDPKKAANPLSLPAIVPDRQGPGAKPLDGVEVLDRGNLTDYELQQFLEQRLLPTVRRHWHVLIPDRARRLQKRETAVVTFSIQKDGTIDSVHLEQSTEDPELDKAALEGIQSSAPVALPEKFSGDHLRVRFRFVYEKAK